MRCVYDLSLHKFCRHLFDFLDVGVIGLRPPQGWPQWLNYRINIPYQKRMSEELLRYDKNSRLFVWGVSLNKYCYSLLRFSFRTVNWLHKVSKVVLHLTSFSLHLKKSLFEGSKKRVSSLLTADDDASRASIVANSEHVFASNFVVSSVSFFIANHRLFTPFPSDI